MYTTTATYKLMIGRINRIRHTRLVNTALDLMMEAN